MSNETNIEKKVLEKIRKGGVSMRPKYYFVLRISIIGVIAFLTIACSVLTFSFVAFSIHESGERFLLGFGTQGIVTFLALFPWLVFIFSIVLLIALETLLRNFKFAYRLPLLRIFLWTVGVVGITGFLLSLSPLHRFLLDRADHDQLPFIGSFYEEIHDSHQLRGVYRGDITAITDSGFTIGHNDADRDSDDGSWIIVPPTGFSTSTLSIGESVYVAGHLVNGLVYAYGIQIVPQDE